MYASIALAALGLTGLVASAPSSTRAVKSRQDSSALNVVYWGQNGGSAEENNDLSYYCQADSDIDIIVLAFLYEFGNGVTTPGGLIGIDCTISTSGEPSSCDAVASSITTCRQAGVKVILSIGGSSDGYSIASQSDAEAMGQYLWDAYGNSGNTTVTRPFGDAVVDGFDFDIEEPNGQEYYQYVISTLRSNFAKDPSNTYYITGAPQCPIPEPNMGVIIGNSTFDYIWIQYYNNNDYQPDPCSLGLPGDAPFNYNQWVDFIATTPSKDAKLFIGAPAGPLAANGGPTGEVYYATPSQLATIIQDTKGNASFGGVMLWSAAASDGNVNDGCTYAQEVKNIFDTGSPCSGSPPTNTLSSMSISQPTSTATAPTSSSTGTVQQWGQCGGEGYSGATQCVSPYTCKVLSEWYSECE